MRASSSDSFFVKLNHLGFSYYSNLGESKVLSDISLSIKKKDFVAIVGPSGCGKSTILSLISGLLKPEKGYITFYSEDFSTPHIGYMLQHDHLLEWRSVYKNIILGLEIQKKKTPENIKLATDLLEKYNLSHVMNQKPCELSGGMRQRIALIRTLATSPDLLLLDEPFSALDYQTRLNISNDVREIIKTEEKTAILVTHDITEAITMADVVVVLSKAPCKIKDIIPIEFEKNGITRDEIRTSKLFQNYFDKIWREMQDENRDKEYYNR